MASTALRQYKMRDGIWRGLNGVADIVPVTGPPPPPPPGEAASPPTFVAASSIKASAGGLRVSWPSGHQDNDICLLYIETANEVISLPDPQGFVLVGTQQGTGTAGDPAATRIANYWCRATSSAMPSPLIFDPTDHISAVLLVFRGCLTTGDPFTVLGADVLTPAGTTVTIPGGTTTVDQCLVVATVAHGIDNVTGQVSGFTNTSLTSLTERVNAGGASGNGGGFGIATGIRAVAGTVSATTATVTSSTQARQAIALKPVPGSSAPPPDVETTLRTMVGILGAPTASSRPKSTWGFVGGTPAGGPIKPTPDALFSDSNGANLVGPNGYIEAARLSGACLQLKVTGGNGDDVADPVTGDFSPSLWAGKWDGWWAGITAQAGWTGAFYTYTGGVDEIRKAVADGVLRHILVLDDFIAAAAPGANGYTHAVTYEKIEEACAHSKGIASWLPLVARGVNTYLRAAAVDANGAQRQYQYLDAGWAQWRSARDQPRTGTYAVRAAAYYAANVAAGEACGLGLIGGANILNQGDGLTVGWGCQRGDQSNGCGMSPDEIEASGLAVMANPKVCGWNPWAYSSTTSLGTTYYHKPEILAALLVVYNASVGRFEGRCNIRGDLAIP